MEIQLKHRILGAVITVIALAISLPVVLDKTRHLEVLQADIPPMPDIPDWASVDNKDRIRSEAIELIDGSAQKKLLEQDAKVVNQDEPEFDQIKPNQAGLDGNKLPVAWALQLGAFRDQQNANVLVTNLRSKGYKAFTDDFPKDGLIRVYVGPELKRQTIEELQQKLQKELKQQDIHIKRWQPGK